MKISTENSIHLFTFSAYPLGTLNNKGNRNIMASAIKKGVLIPNLNNSCINGEQFDMPELTIKILQPRTVNETLYVKITKNGYLLSIRLAYSDHVGKNKLKNIMHSLKVAQ